MFLKLMGEDSVGDGDASHTFTMLDDVALVSFSTDDATGQGFAHVQFRNGASDTYALKGTVYLINEEGRTVDKFRVKEK